MSDLNKYIEGLEAEMKEPEATEEPTVAEDAPVESEEPKAEDHHDAEQVADVKVEDSPSESDDTDKQTNVPLKALEEERHKRQELERQLLELRNEVLGGKKQESEPEKPIDLFEDPEGRLNQMQAAMQQQLEIQRIQMSEVMAKNQYEDYDSKMDRFLAEANQNPALIDQMRAHPHPAQFAYETANKLLKLEEIQDLDSYKESVSKDLRAQIEAELKAKYEAKQQKAAELPQGSVSDASSAQVDEKTKLVDVDSAITDILSSNKKTKRS